MRFAPSALGFATALASLLSAGCECSGVQCGVCSGVAITIEVIDATSRMPIEDANVVIDGKACSVTGFQGPGVYACDGGAGAHTVQVSAPGHVSKTLAVTLKDDEDDSCCSCGPQTGATAELDPTTP
jgi:hypothetical protein